MLYAMHTDVGIYNDGYLHFKKNAKTILLEHDEKMTEEQLKTCYNESVERAKKPYYKEYEDGYWIITEEELIKEMIKTFGFRLPQIEASIIAPKIIAGESDHSPDETMKKIED